MSNKIITENSKKEILRLTTDRIKVEGSQNKYARSKAISEATMSNFMKEKWETISDEMWRKLAAACGYSDDSWQLAETAAFRDFTELIQDAQYNANVYAIIGTAGLGKSATANFYTSNTPNSYWLECDEFWNKKQFLSELLQSMGRNADGMTAYEMMVELKNHVTKLDSPVIILDEVDKLKDEVLYFFISLYNRLQGQCGIILCATDFLEKRIKKGLRLNRKGYKEIYSRLGRKFIELPEPASIDIALICRANGIEDKATIKTIIQDAESDLRRVKKLVHKHKTVSNG